MDDLTGRRVLITNVGIGPGPAIVAELTRRGARVAIQHAYDDKVAKETATKISGLTGSEPAIVQGDLRHVSECDRAVEEAAEALDGLDVLVNNAGVVRPRGFLDTDEAVYNEVFDLNVKGYLLCAKRAVPFMLEAGGGSVVNVSCIHGHGGLPPRCAYALRIEWSCVRMSLMEIYSKDLRIRALAAVDRGIPRREVVEIFAISLTTLKRWIKMSREGKDLSPGVSTGRRRRILSTPEEEGLLWNQLEENDDATLERHCELWEQKTGVRVSVSAMSRAIRERLGWSYKKRRWVPPSVTKNREVLSESV